MPRVTLIRRRRKTPLFGILLTTGSGVVVAALIVLMFMGTPCTSLAIVISPSKPFQKGQPVRLVFVCGLTTLVSFRWAHYECDPTAKVPFVTTSGNFHHKISSSRTEVPILSQRSNISFSWGLSLVLFHVCGDKSSKGCCPLLNIVNGLLLNIRNHWHHWIPHIILKFNNILGFGLLSTK